MRKLFIFKMLLCICLSVIAQDHQMLQTATVRNLIDLNGQWNILMGPYGGGNAKGLSRPGKDGNSLTDRLMVPGDWNTQSEKLYYYEGSIHYKRVFSKDVKPGKRYFIHLGSANYQASVYLNGEFLGEHSGGFTPFSFEVTDHLIGDNNALVVKVSNTREVNSIPSVRFDWWNYGGLTRSVNLVEVPEQFISDYFIYLDQDNPELIKGWVQLSNSQLGEEVQVEITDLKIQASARVNGKGHVFFELKSRKINYWTPENPVMYPVKISTNQDSVTEEMGLRIILVSNGDILLNGKKVFLRGINIHEEAPMGQGRITTVEECRTLLTWAKELGCNFVRLAHYPHSELMVKEAERLGLMVWSEIPVYWNIDFNSEVSLDNANQMLKELITRDKNRASTILWSVANETKDTEPRLRYLKSLLKTVKEMDHTRLTTAALEAYKEVEGVRVIDDPLGEYIDVIGINCYCGWYFKKLEDCVDQAWKVIYEKPVIFSEFGAGALKGYREGENDKYTEKYQDEVYRCNIEMIKNQMPFLDGMTPWILMDFRSPIRYNRSIHNDYNRKGLLTEQGIRKKAFYRLQAFYNELKEK